MISYILKRALPLFLLLNSVALGNVIGVDTQNFNPTTNGLDFVTVQSSETLTPGFFNFGLFLNYAKDTLPVFAGNSDDSSTTDSLTSLDLSVGYGITRIWDFGLSFPYLLNQTIKSDQFRGEFAKTGATEVRVNTKLRLFGGQDGGVAAIVSANFNRVANNPYIGIGGGPTYNFELAGDFTVSAVALGMNLGYRKRSPGEALPEFPIEPFSDQFVASVAASFLLPGMDTKLIFEVWHSQPVKEVGYEIERQQSSQEAILGAKFDATPRLALHIGGGRELNHSNASPNLRVYTGLNWVVGNKKKSSIKKARITRKKKHSAPLPPPAPEEQKDEEPIFVVEEEADEVFILRDVNFAFDSDYQVLAGAKTELHNLAENAKAKTYARIVIEGHTDSLGTEEYNQELGLRRAQAIRAYLIQFEGLDPTRLKALSFGEVQPMANNGNEQGRQINRRVVFKLYFAH